MSEVRIEKFKEIVSDKWDKFVIEEALNGTFLQTRKFLNYHPRDKFVDSSLMFFYGNEPVAVIPACEVKKDGEKIFYSHQGSTFGGLIISEKTISCSMMEKIIDAFERYLSEEKYDRAFLKQTSAIYSKQNTPLLDFFLYNSGWTRYDELNFYMDLEKYQNDIVALFTSGKRRDYRYSLKNGLLFKELTSDDEIKDFYRVLNLNLKKLNLSCVHTYEELLDLKNNRFPNNVFFYGVLKDNRLISGSMVFVFTVGVFHTQYLCSDEEFLNLFPMEFLITNLISEAVKRQMVRFSFGISTEKRGRYLNMGLARFKEGFGAGYTTNVSYEKQIKYERL